MRSAPSTGPRRLTAAEIARARQVHEAQVASEHEQRQREFAIRGLIELDATDIAILTLHLAHPWMTQEQIGQHEHVRLGRQAVSQRMTAEKFARALAEAGKSDLEILQRNRPKAARVLGELLSSQDERVKIRAAIAHLWPLIHADAGGTGEGDFVRFIQEAYEEAEKQRAATAAAAGEVQP